MRAETPARRSGWWAALVVASNVAVAAPVTAQPPTADVNAAVEAAVAAVRQVFGPEADVRITTPVLQVAANHAAVVKAIPEPSSRTAGPVRFVLYGPPADGFPHGTRAGRLTATVRVRLPHVRAQGPVEARSRLDLDAIAIVDADIGRQSFDALPTLEEASGALVRRPLVAGAVVTRSALVARPLVASGDEVVTVARVGSLEVRGRAIAAQSGALGETVIVVNPDSRKRLHARVVASALVEVVHGS